MPATVYPHVAVRKDGVPVVRGTQFKIVQIIRDHVEQGWQADQIQKQHPALSLAQIHGALAYYYDHQAELDTLMKQRDQRANGILATLPPSPVRERLLQAKRQG